MSKVVCHIQKRKGGSGGLTAHIDRQVWDSEKGEMTTFTPLSVIHPERTALNKEYVMEKGKTLSKTIEDQIKTRVTRKPRTDAVTNIGLLITSDHEKMMEIEKAGRLDEWARDCIRMAQEFFGKENVIGAALHMDEHTPHLHITVVPIIEGQAKKQIKRGETADTKKRRYKKQVVQSRLSAKDMINPTSLTQLQDKAAEYMKKWGMDRGEIGSLAKHKTTAEWKIEQMQQEVQLEEEILDEAKKNTANAEAAAKKAEQAKAQAEEATEKAKEEYNHYDKALKGDGTAENPGLRQEYSEYSKWKNGTDLTEFNAWKETKATEKKALEDSMGTTALKEEYNRYDKALKGDGTAENPGLRQEYSEYSKWKETTAAEITKLNDAKTQAEEKTEKLRNEKSTLLKELNGDVAEGKKGLRTEVDDLKKEKQTLKNDIADIPTRAQLLSDTEELRDKKSTLLKELNGDVAEGKKGLLRQVSDAEKKLNGDGTTDNPGLNKQISDAEEKLKNIPTIEQAQAEYNKKTKELQEKYDNLENKYNNLQNDYDAKKEELEKSIETEKEEYDKIHDKLSYLVMVLEILKFFWDKIIQITNVSANPASNRVRIKYKYADDPKEKELYTYEKITSIKDAKAYIIHRLEEIMLQEYNKQQDKGMSHKR